ncbi:MAG: hypothetical protein HOO96_31495 [Polyangiaceae bacterium]|nr:hypothetical protein [Polyangiaceae bacterium]
MKYSFQHRCSTAVGTLVCATALLHASRAEATEPRRVVVMVEGKESEPARQEITSALAGNAVVEPSRDLSAALAQGGQRGALGASLNDPRKHDAVLSRVVAAAHTLRLDRVVVVTLGGPGHAGQARVRIVDVNGQRDTVAEVPWKRGEGAVGRKVRDEVEVTPGPSSADSATESASAPAVSPTTVDSGAPPTSPRKTDSSSKRGSIVEGALGFGAAGRRFRYSDPLSTGLRRYDLSAAPMIGVSGGVYPFASLSRTVDAGLTGGFASAVGVSSESRDGADLGTRWSRFFVGARGRWHATGAMTLGLDLAYAGETFTFEESRIDAQVPSVGYRFVRAGADVAVSFGRFGIEAAAAYDAVTAAGSVANRFPRASIGGFDFAVGPSVSLGYGFSAVAKLEYRRLVYAMHPEPGDRFVAGGAMDELYGLQGGVAYAY